MTKLTDKPDFPPSKPASAGTGIGDRGAVAGAQASGQASPPPPTPSSKKEGASPLTCHRQIVRQATSAVAYSAEPPPPDDPLLDFEPVPHKAPRRNSITPDLQRAFIAHLAATGIVKAAAKHIGKSMEAIYKLRQRPGAEGFNAAWEEALQWGVLRLEDCAIERAIHEGLSNKRANSLLAFILAYRSHHRVDERHIVPGHPIYEQIRDEVLEEEMLV